MKQLESSIDKLMGREYPLLSIDRLNWKDDVKDGRKRINPGTRDVHQGIPRVFSRDSL